MQKRDMCSCRNDFNVTGISDALVEMGEATHPVARKLLPKAKPLRDFSGG
jgi:hypothetical protein